jgi:hypothetical protein
LRSTPIQFAAKLDSSHGLMSHVLVGWSRPSLALPPALGFPRHRLFQWPSWRLVEADRRGRSTTGVKWAARGAACVACSHRLSLFARRTREVPGPSRACAPSHLLHLFAFARSALIFAHRTFAARDIFARAAADRVLLAFVPLRLLA